MKPVSCTLTRAEICVYVLQSRRFAMKVGDAMRDELSDERASLLAYYVNRVDDLELGRVVREIFSGHVQKILNDEIDAYQPSMVDCEDRHDG